MSSVDDKSGTGVLGTYAQWAEAFSKKDLERALKDQAVIRHAQLNDGNDYCRTTPSGLTKSAYDNLRAGRDDLDNRDWNSDTGFSGLSRTPPGPGITGRGVETTQQKKRRARRELLDDGF